MSQKRTRVMALIASAALLSTLAACSDDGSGDSPKVSAPEAGQIGSYTFPDKSIPNFACTDDSYAKVREKGITLGIVNAPPYSVVAKNSEPTGLDNDLWKEVMKYIGVTKIRYEVGDWSTLIPGVLSDRIDIGTSPLHENPERNGKVAFTSPSYWYGPSISVAKGNPKNITSYKDLLRDDVKVGAVAGTTPMIYLEKHNAPGVASFDSFETELESLTSGRLDAVLEDEPVVADYIKKRSGANVELIDADPPADVDVVNTMGYGYVRYVLNPDACTLNYAVSRALGELRAAGVVKELLDKYGFGHVDAPAAILAATSKK